jgi:AP-3 complex subunit delta-1
MSLLYECINGIIQGGILDNSEDISGTDEIATLCVNKLRGMVMIDGDPNRKIHCSLDRSFFTDWLQ